MTCFRPVGGRPPVAATPLEKRLLILVKGSAVYVIPALGEQQR